MLYVLWPILLAVAGSGEAAPAARGITPDGSAQEAYVVFAKACASCHSDRVRRGKGDFGFVLDLRRLSRAGEFVVRGQPEASSLLRVMEDGSMPPARSRVPALTPADLDAVRDWILDGAPAGPIDTSALPPLLELGESSAAAGYTGRLHPLVVHFPIGLLFAAALAEILFALARDQRFRSAAEFCLVLGTAGALAATASGWFFADDLDYTMTMHRWLGVATSLFALAACQLAARVRRLPPTEAPLNACRAALLVTLLLLVVTSHLGGAATWGDIAFAN